MQGANYCCSTLGEVLRSVSRRRRVSLECVNKVFLTHFHLDHVIDVSIFFFGSNGVFLFGRVGISDRTENRCADESRALWGCACRIKDHNGLTDRRP